MRPETFDKTGKQQMANKTSAKKAIRVIERRTDVNVRRRSRIRTHIKNVEQAIASGDKDAAAKALRDAQPEIIRGAQKGVAHRNTAARKISRLSRRVNAM
jgi:small subunit ribosomal protein S20